MLFNSLAFAVFFPLAILGYFLLHGRARLAWLLLASGVFYAAYLPRYLLVLIGLILLDYVAGRCIESATGRRRRLLLAMSLGGNLAVLGVFKYLPFLVENVNAAAGWAGLRPWLPALSLALPIGLSFHTFQSMAYTIEVYRGRWPAERDLLRYALYVLFWPQLVAGPIERPEGLLAQLHHEHAFDPARAGGGLRLMLWGLFKKIVVADRLAPLVAAVYDNPRRCGGPAIALATVFFAFQIYCDFSGYSDIAIGAARVMGFNLMTNFRRPYFARSPADFWRRWHVSLSTWFRDYVYFPLGGSRVVPTRWALNIMIVFILSGFWHGAAWTFLVWGTVHGVAILVTRRWERDRAPPPLRAAAHTAATFAGVCLGWVFFRAGSLRDSAAALAGLVAGWDERGFLRTLDQLGPDALGGAVFWIAVLLAFDAWQEWGAPPVPALWPAWRRWSLYYAAVAAIFAFGRFDRSPFIYFQF